MRIPSIILNTTLFVFLGQVLHAAKASFLPEDEKAKLVAQVKEKLDLFEKQTI